MAGGCQSGWGQLLSVTNAIEAGTCRQRDVAERRLGVLEGVEVTPPPIQFMPGVGGWLGLGQGHKAAPRKRGCSSTRDHSVVGPKPHTEANGPRAADARRSTVGGCM